MENDDFLDSIETTGSVDPETGTATGEIEVARDRDWFAFEATAEQILRFDVDLGNVQLDIFDANGKIVASSIGGFRGDSIANEIIFQAQTSGTFYLSVTGILPRAGEGFTGPYSISSTVLPNDDFSDTIEGATTITAGTTSGRFDDPTDVDVFAIEVTAGTVITLEGIVGTSQYQLLDASGAIIPVNGGANSGINRLEYAATETGTIYLSVSKAILTAATPRVGDYSFTITTAELPAVNFIDGTNRQDTIQGTVGVDDIVGLGGDDLIFGRSGDDKIFGGAGDDRLNGEDGDDELFGQAGDDTLTAGDGDDYLNGGGGNDMLFGGEGDDGLFGGGGNDALYGDKGDDFMAGGGGNDIMRGGSGEDVMQGGAGNDRLFGQNGDDVMNGQNGNDALFGGNGADLIRGQAGRDTLVGQKGNDLLVGGDGADRFVFREGDGFDRIQDFTSGEDRLDVRSFDFDSFDDLNFQTINNTVYLFLSEDQSIEFTGIHDIADIQIDDVLI